MSIKAFSTVCGLIRAVLAVLVLTVVWDYAEPRMDREAGEVFLFLLLIAGVIFLIVRPPTKCLQPATLSDDDWLRRARKNSLSEMAAGGACLLLMLLFTPSVLAELVLESDMDFEGMILSGYVINCYEDCRNYLLAYNAVGVIGGLIVYLLSQSSTAVPPAYQAPPSAAPADDSVPPPTSEVRACPACGYEQPANRRVCFKCGHSFGLTDPPPAQEPVTPPPPAGSFCPHCGGHLPEPAPFCVHCGKPVDEPPRESAPPPPPPPGPSTVTPPVYTGPSYAPPADRYGGMPMKWYKYLIYFSLFASAVLNVISGILYLTGAQYGDSADWLYARFENLKTLDALYGLGLFGFAALALWARFRLAGMCQNGPRLALWLWGGGVAATLIYALVVVATGAPTAEGYYLSVALSVVCNMAVLACQYVYFEKRKHLFVN